MYFTQDDYLKIQKWLSRNSVRDTEFQEADTPLRGNETVVLVQNGHNRKILISDLVDQIFTLGTTDFLNVSEFSKQYKITLEEAIILVPPKSRKEGQVISFNNEEGNWEIYQFTGNVNQWTSIDLWKPFLADIPKGSITLDHLSQEVKDAINSGGGVGEIVDGSINTNKLANHAVTSEKIAHNNITSDHISEKSIEEKHLSPTLVELLYNESESTIVKVPTDTGDFGLPVDVIYDTTSNALRIHIDSTTTTVLENKYPNLKGELWVIKNYETDGHGNYKDTFAYVFASSLSDAEATHDAYIYEDLEVISKDYKTTRVFEQYKYDNTTLYNHITTKKLYKMSSGKKLYEAIHLVEKSLQDALNLIYSKLGLLT